GRDVMTAVDAGHQAAGAAQRASGGQAVIIRTLNLEKSFGMGESTTYALRGVDSTIYRGEFIAVMGPSGSGKSTYFNMIGALDSPTKGRILIDEVDVAQLSANELAFLRRSEERRVGEECRSRGSRGA